MATLTQRDTGTETIQTLRLGDDTMPVLGLGTWQLEGDECYEAVRDALDLGYRHIDTAQAYENEDQVGKALRDAGVDRDKVFLTTKVWYETLREQALIESVEASLSRLRTAYVDLLLIHWPSTDGVPLEETLGAMNRLKAAGSVKHLGVSNFPPSLVEEARRHADITCNQVEYHPYLSQRALLDTLRPHGTVLTAYSPLARGRVMDDDTLQAIGARHGKSAAQVTLRWLVQQEGVAAVPRSSSNEHRRSNLDIFDFSLDAEEMRRIDALGGDERLIDPDFAPDWER